MQPDYLLPELECGEDGAGPIVETIPTQCVLTLGITQVTEREGLEVSIWGSEDGENWGPGRSSSSHRNPIAVSIH
jgi:hypothetical protein